MSGAEVETDPTEYLHAVEERYQQLRGEFRMLSPEDFQRALRWHADGVPLFVVLDALDAVFRRAAERKPRRTPRSLAYVEPAVEESFTLWREGQLGARRGRAANVDARGDAALLEDAAQAVLASMAPPDARDAAAAALRALSISRPDGSSSTEIVLRIARALEDACLASLAPADRAAIDDEARAELAPYVAEMAPAIYERARASATARLLRRRFALPDVALLPLTV